MKPSQVGFGASVGYDEDVYFGETDEKTPSSPEPNNNNYSTNFQDSTRQKETPFSFQSNELRGVTLEKDLSDPYPFVHAPLVFKHNGENFCSITVELSNAVDPTSIEVEVGSDQLHGHLSFCIFDNVMKAKSIFFDNALTKGSSFYESVKSWRMEGRRNDAEKWDATISFEFPFKVEFKTYSNIPNAINQKLVQRKVGHLTLQTIMYIFRQCPTTFATSTKVRMSDVFIVDSESSTSD